jgi:hypothetical protein
MRTIEDTPHSERFLMITHRLSRAAWERQCSSVRAWLANPPDMINQAKASEMLGIIAEPLHLTYHPFIVIYCYADIPANTRWDTAFDPSNTVRNEKTDATLKFGIFWSRLVIRSLEDGHHQVAVLEFPHGLPPLIESLPVVSVDEPERHVGLCNSNDLLAIQGRLP